MFITRWGVKRIKEAIHNNNILCSCHSLTLRWKTAYAMPQSSQCEQENGGFLNFEHIDTFSKKSTKDLVRGYCILKITSYDVVAKYSERVRFLFYCRERNINGDKRWTLEIYFKNLKLRSLWQPPVDIL